MNFTLGIIGPAFGLKGFVKVKSLSGETAHFLCLKKVSLRQGDKVECREVAETAYKGEALLMRFAGIDSPEAARVLKGAEIVAGREFAAPLKEGEFYVEDLKGLEVITQAGGVLGHIIDVLEGGGGDLAEVMLVSGEKRLAPFRKEFFGDVDPENRRIIILEPWILE